MARNVNLKVFHLLDKITLLYMVIYFYINNFLFTKNTDFIITYINKKKFITFETNILVEIVFVL